MNIVKWLKSEFNKVEEVETPSTPKSKYEGYEVEYYPTTQAYYAVFYGQYLKKNYFKGHIELLRGDWYYYATKCTSEAHAWALVDQHIEEQTKSTVRVFRRVG